MANVCFGCHDTEDIEKCPKVKCAYYGYREQHMEMDDEANAKRTLLVRRGSRDIAMYKPGGKSIV